MRRWLVRLSLSAVVAVAAALAAWLWFRGYRTAPDRYPIHGIDVSHHQGAIDWKKVAGDGVAFAYLKATEGGDHRDRTFARNWREARAAGIAVGAYHFFTFCRPGAEQAANVLAVVPAAPDALPPAVDLEFGGNCGRVPDGAAMRRRIEERRWRDNPDRILKRSQDVKRQPEGIGRRSAAHRHAFRGLETGALAIGDQLLNVFLGGRI